MRYGLMHSKRACEYGFDAVGATWVKHFVEIGSLGHQIKADIDFLLEFVWKIDREESEKKRIVLDI